jgi:hypothetical protein
MSRVLIYSPISKVEELADGSLYVEGIASTESRDEDPKAIRKFGKGEKILASAIKGAIPGYMRWGAVREMHEAIAAGTAVKIEVDDAGVTHLGAHIVDEGSVKKVKASVLKGLSLGGDATRRNSQDPSIIEEMTLTEISLVDRPANPECALTLVKVSKELEMANVAVTPPVVAAVAVTPPVVAAESAAVPSPLKKYLGEEAYDAGRALACLVEIQSLFCKEVNEAHPEAAGQVADLKAVIERLKSFIASEVAEVEPEAAPVALAAEAGDIAKAGAKFSGATKKAMADHHDALTACHKALKKCADAFGKMGWKDSAEEDEGAKKAAEIGDIEKRASDAEAATAAAGDALKKVLTERDDLAKRLEDATLQLKTKGYLGSSIEVQKVADSGGEAAEVEAEPTTTVDSIKKVFKSGGKKYPFGFRQ